MNNRKVESIIKYGTKKDKIAELITPVEFCLLNLDSAMLCFI
jgi:hypothetical protein